MKVTDIDADDIERTSDTLRSLPSNKLISGGASMAFHFDPRLQKIQVTTTVDAAVLSSLLGDSWHVIDYHHGEVAPAGRFNDASPFKGC